MIQHIVPVYFLRDGIQARIETVQGDSGREFVFNAEDITLTNDMSAKVYIEKPSGLSCYSNAAIQDNAVTVKATTQMLAETGASLGQIQLYRGNEKVTSFLFRLDVKGSKVDGTGIESKDEFTILEQTIKEAQAAINAAKEAARKAESAAEAANTSSSNADTAAEKANTEAGKAVTAAGNANDAAALAAEKAGNAETAATNANAVYEKLKNMNVEQVNQDITDIKVAIAKTIMVEG